MTPDGFRLKLPVPRIGKKQDGTVDTEGVDRNHMAIQRAVNRLPFFATRYETFAPNTDIAGTDPADPTTVHTFAIEKSEAATELVFDLRASAFVDSSALVTAYVSIDDADPIQVASHFFNVTNTHLHFTGILVVPAIRSGTLSIAIGAAASAGTLSTDGNDFWTMIVREQIAGGITP